MTQTKTDNKSSSLGIGIGVAATLAAVYFLYGTKAGRQRRKQVRGWMLRAKGEVVEKLEQAKDLNEGAYHRIIDSVVKRYERLKSVDPVELAALAKDMKLHWQKISRQIGAPTSKKKS